LRVRPAPRRLLAYSPFAGSPARPSGQGEWRTKRLQATAWRLRVYSDHWVANPIIRWRPPRLPPKVARVVQVVKPVVRLRGPESPDTYQAVYEFTPSRGPDTFPRFPRGERSPITLLAVPANSVPVPEDRPGPIIGLPFGVDYACIKRFFLMLPPWMITQTWMSAPTAGNATWRGFAGKTFRTVDRLLCQREAAVAQQPTDETEAERRTVTALRGLWIQQLLDEFRRPLAKSLWVVTV